MRIKKVLLTAVLCLLVSFSLVSQDDDSLATVNGYFDFSDAGVEVYISPDWVLFDGEKIGQDAFRLDANGYYYVKDNIVLFDQFHHLLAWHNTSLNMHPLVESKNSYGAGAVYSASSYLTETIGGKEIAYTADDLNTILAKPYIKHQGYFFQSIKNQERFFIWNEEHKPWVADGGNKGLGSTVTAVFDSEINCVSFLNGYVDPYHPDYYKKNSRIKDIKITDEDNGIDYFFTLDDEVRVQTFMLDTTARKVTMTVLSVYEGEKYQDICLSLFTGVYVDTYIDWIVFSELSNAKENAEYAYEQYERDLLFSPDDVPHDLELIKQDWELYSVLVYDRIKKEFGNQLISPDIEFYKDADIRINLEVYSSAPYISFYVNDTVKSVSYKFNGPKINISNAESEEYTIVFDNPSDYRFKDHGAYLKRELPGDSYLILAESVWLQIEYTDGTKKEVFVSDEGLASVRRFGELLISVCDLR